jgi:trk system potassium uptake protein TrkH
MVILLLIQTGGLGFVTMAIAITTFTKRRIGISSGMSCRVGRRAFPGRHRAAVPLRRALRARFEGGAPLFGAAAVPLLGFWKGISIAVFHTLSAFCNAAST